MLLTIGEMVKIVLKRQGMTMGDLAEKLGQSRQNLSNKFSRDNFSENEAREIAAALGVEFKCTFILQDGSEI